MVWCCTWKANNHMSRHWSHKLRSAASATPSPWSRKKRCNREKPVWSGPARYRRKPCRRASVWTSCGDKAQDKGEDGGNMCPARFQCCCKSNTSHRELHQHRPQNLAICRMAPNCSADDQDGEFANVRPTPTKLHIASGPGVFWAVGTSVPIAHRTVDVTKALNTNDRKKGHNGRPQKAILPASASIIASGTPKNWTQDSTWIPSKQGGKAEGKDQPRIFDLDTLICSPRSRSAAMKQGKRRRSCPILRKQMMPSLTNRKVQNPACQQERAVPHQRRASARAAFHTCWPKLDWKE